MSLAYILLPLLAQSGAEVDAAEFGGDPPECADPVTQQDMNYCAALEWEEADAELNRQWRETVSEIQRLDAQTTPGDGRPGYFEQLLEAQRAWLTFRDGHCASVGYHARGGSLEPLLVANCRTALTRERTEQLRQLEQWPD